MTTTEQFLDYHRRLREAIEVRRRAALKRRATMRQYDYTPVTHVRMIVSPWFADEHGVPTRTVRAV